MISGFLLFLLGRKEKFQFNFFKLDFLCGFGVVDKQPGDGNFEALYPVFLDSRLDGLVVGEFFEVLESVCLFSHEAELLGGGLAEGAGSSRAGEHVAGFPAGPLAQGLAQESLDGLGLAPQGRALVGGEASPDLESQHADVICLITAWWGCVPSRGSG
jgi:hypothetical protein